MKVELKNAIRFVHRHHVPRWAILLCLAIASIAIVGMTEAWKSIFVVALECAFQTGGKIVGPKE